MTLMDKVDEMIFEFEVTMDDISLHDLKAPWFKLHQFSNETNALDEMFTNYFDASDRIDNFNDASVDKVIFNSFFCYNTEVLHY